MKDTMAHLHLVCQDWQRELAFYKGEIPFFRKRLEEIVSKNTAHEILTQAEHFENKFSIMLGNYDELLHDVHLLDTSLLHDAAEKPAYIHVKMVETDDQLVALMEDTAADFRATKNEFYRFLSKYL